MDLSPEQIRWGIQALIILILSITVHEFGHAIIAHKLGDRLPDSQGRVTLNPISHADPFGTLLFPAMGIFLTGGLGFGWGRPVQVNPVSFTRRFTMRTGHMFVAAAGPAMNLFFGTLIAVITVALLRFQVISPDQIELYKVLDYAVKLNFVLLFFNLVPVPPLDGHTVLEGLLPSRWVPAFHRFYQNYPYLPFILLLGVILIPQLRIIFIGPALFLQETIFRVLFVLFGLS